MRMPSVMQHQFSLVPKAEIPRSVFDRTHCHKTTFNAGHLIPFYVDEVLPGDTFNVKATIFARLATPIVPFMDNLYLDTFYFFVPLRLLWTNFQKFCGEQTDPGASTDFSTPYLVSPAVTGFEVGSLFDYFGLPTGIPGLTVNAFHSRAYNLIYNEWFRDQNMQDSVVVDKDDGPDAYADYVILNRGKRHDYFTSCLPWPQKGDAVSLPLGEDAPVVGIGKFNQTYAAGPVNAYETDGVGASSYPNYQTIKASGDNDTFYVREDASHAGYPDIRADLSEATASTINALRQAFQIQKLLERDARGGTRYTEIVRSHFGVVSPDARLQRPEFLGGNSKPIMITPIAQTSETTTGAGGSPLANLAAIGTGSVDNDGFTKSFTEHGVILGICSVRADLTYQQGIPKMFLRRTRWDYYWPALSNIGEQSVLNKEIYAQGTGFETTDEGVFGYQERWAEYRYYPSKITGKLRSTYATPLDMWHLSQEFAALPTLSDTFIIENPPMDRVIAVSTEPHFIMDSFIKVKSVRPMPVYSVPGLIDHF